MNAAPVETSCPSSPNSATSSSATVPLVPLEPLVVNVYSVPPDTNTSLGNASRRTITSMISSGTMMIATIVHSATALLR